MKIKKLNEFQEVADSACGADGLFEVIVRALDGDHCRDINDAIWRMETMRAEVEAVLQGLHALKQHKAQAA